MFFLTLCANVNLTNPLFCFGSAPNKIMGWQVWYYSTVLQMCDNEMYCIWAQY